MAFTINLWNLSLSQIKQIILQTIFFTHGPLEYFIPHEHRLVKYMYSAQISWKNNSFLGILISFRCTYKVKDHLVCGSVSDKPIVHCYSGAVKDFCCRSHGASS